MYERIKYNASAFYDKISSSYDEMFDFEHDLKAAKQAIAALKKRFAFKKALDIGCGTGSFTIALAQSGVTATGMDLSALMLAEARRNSIACEQNIDLVYSGMTEMSANIDDSFDLIICMGNTLAHLLNKKELFTMLGSSRELLNPGGHLVLGLLNYDKILEKQERIVGITRNEKHEFIRFYDFEKPYVNFNLLEIDWNTATPSYKLASTRLYPYTADELESALKQNGFKDFNINIPKRSKSVLITAARG
jgi:2-polyprenyl-3-methyl-5-hydroxy-6-metoxy-1,4-benzoquinol methylase